jgi:hypothetical protein
MSRTRTVLALVVLCVSSFAAFAAYDQTWYQANFWSGEYPNGFSIVKDGVSIAARGTTDLDAPADIQCALPKKAVFHPWNGARQAEYRTYSKIVPMVANEDLQIGFTEVAQVRAGETIEYLVYGAEGMFFVRYNGVEYEADQELLTKVTYDEKAMETPQDEWMNVTCLDGSSAWIFMRDLYTFDRDGNTVWLAGLDTWFLGFRDYGNVTDLTDEELPK